MSQRTYIKFDMTTGLILRTRLWLGPSLSSLLLIAACGSDPEGESNSGGETSSESTSESESSTTSPTGDPSESQGPGTSPSGTETEGETGSTDTETTDDPSAGSETSDTEATVTDSDSESDATTVDPPTTDPTDSTSDTEDPSDTDTDPTDSDTEGETTDTEGETDTDSDSDSEGETDTEGIDIGHWLITIHDRTNPTSVAKIDVITGMSTHLCFLDVNHNYNTSTFSRNGLLYAANATTKDLEIIDPCTCERTVVGPTMVNALPGITADQMNGLYGLETSQDIFVDIDENSGLATEIGPVGLNWGTGGLSWSDELQDTYAINGTDDKLYRIDHNTGQAFELVQTDHNFGSVGIEYHPSRQQIYACSNPGILLNVDADTGVVTEIGPMNLMDDPHCDNLAAPWTLVQCVEDA